jgi:hypothetical protein
VEFGIDPLRLVPFAVKLEELEQKHGTLPLATLARARTVGDVVELVEVWSRPRSLPER